MKNINRFFFPMLLLTTVVAGTVSQANDALTSATAGEWQPRQSAFARVSARQQIRLSLPFAVRILSLPVEPGARVEAGQILAIFDAPRLRRLLAEWRLARQEQMLSQRQLKVFRRNRQEKTITQRELLDGEQATAKAVARADLTWQALTAELDLLNVKADASNLASRIEADGLNKVARELSQMKAPFTGVVTRRRTAEGEQLSADATILELESLDRVYLDVGVPESALSQWRQGQSYWQSPSGKINLQPVDGLPRLDSNSGLWLLRFEAPNPGYHLQDHAWIEVWNVGSPEPVTWLPKQAVASRNGKTWVIVSGDEGPKPVEVEVGPIAADGRIPVIEGIAPGTRVVTEGAYELLYRDLKDLIKFVD